MQNPLMRLDYDEGAADALMALHRDVPSGQGRDVSQQMGTPSPAVNSTAGSKRAASPSSPQAHKKAKSEGISPKPSPAASGSDRIRTVIEVLNTPRIESPLSQATSSADSGRPERKESADRSTHVPSPVETTIDKPSPETTTFSIPASEQATSAMPATPTRGEYSGVAIGGSPKPGNDKEEGDLVDKAGDAEMMAATDTTMKQTDNV